MPERYICPNTENKCLTPEICFNGGCQSNVLSYHNQRIYMRFLAEKREAKRVAEAEKLARCKRCGQAVPREGTRVCNEAKGMECEE